MLNFVARVMSVILLVSIIVVCSTALYGPWPPLPRSSIIACPSQSNSRINSSNALYPFNILQPCHLGLPWLLFPADLWKVTFVYSYKSFILTMFYLPQSICLNKSNYIWLHINHNALCWSINCSFQKHWCKMLYGVMT